MSNFRKESDHRDFRDLDADYAGLDHILASQYRMGLGSRNSTWKGEMPVFGWLCWTDGGSIYGRECSLASGRSSECLGLRIC